MPAGFLQANLSCDPGATIAEIVSVGNVAEKNASPGRCSSFTAELDPAAVLPGANECIGKRHCTTDVKELGTVAIKYSCGTMGSQKERGLWMAAGADMLIMVSFVILMYLLQRNEQRAYVAWDLSITTAADYTVMCSVDRNHYTRSTQSAGDSGHSAPYVYAAWLEESLEKATGSRVAAIEFAFPNARLIRKLIVRGQASIYSDVSLRALSGNRNRGRSGLRRRSPRNAVGIGRGTRSRRRHL